ncbi:MAG: phosphatidylglycerophosphatase A [Bryobacterales bacterium]|nr:phosphatidylglycerophosphatase A [Bryobacteraceae bacterium]MDW8130041.1 phosphatidylglycerophosphatase A [Bryobacterales bacterium]
MEPRTDPPEAPPLARWLASWFGCGYAPKAPGTAGSAVAILLAWLLVRYAGWQPWHFAVLAAVGLAPAAWAASRVAEAARERDPHRVVADEVLGQWVALAGAVRLEGGVWPAAFLLFRIFDIVKPVPIKKVESLPQGLGIVADDIVAGLYAALVLRLAGCFNFY